MGSYEGWKTISIDVHGNLLTANVKNTYNDAIMPEFSVTLQEKYRPYKAEGKAYIKSNFIVEDASLGTWTKILQIDGNEYTPTTDSVASGENELSDTTGFRKMSDDDINKIPADAAGYNYYMFVDSKFKEELVLYVRTKKPFQDTESAFGWKGTNPDALYDVCFLDYLQSISECTWNNHYYPRFGAGVGKDCNQWNFDNDLGPHCWNTGSNGKRCFTKGDDPSHCSLQNHAAANTLRQFVKIYKLDFRILNSNLLKTGVDELLDSITSNPMDATDNPNLTGLSTTSSGTGTGAVVDLVLSGGSVTSITVAISGIGYVVGEKLTVASSDISGSTTDLVITLANNDFVESKKYMEFFENGDTKSYDNMKQSCANNEQRLCTYNEICPNSRFHVPVGGEQDYDDMWLPIENNEWVQVGRGAEGWCQKLSGSSISYDPTYWHTTGPLKTGVDELLDSITSNPMDATDNPNLTGLSTTSSGTGTGAVVDLVLSGGSVTSITVAVSGIGYVVGEKLTVASSDISGSTTDLVITL